MASFRALAHQVARAMPGGIEGAAAQIGVPPQSLRNQLVGCDRHKLDVNDFEALFDVSRSKALAIETAHRCGGVFVELAAGHADSDVCDLAILELITKVMRTNGDVGRVVDEVLADNRVDAQEVELVRDAVIRTQQALADLLHKIEVLAK